MTCRVSILGKRQAQLLSSQDSCRTTSRAWKDKSYNQVIRVFNGDDHLLRSIPGFELFMWNWVFHVMCSRMCRVTSHHLLGKVVTKSLPLLSVISEDLLPRPVQPRFFIYLGINKPCRFVLSLVWSTSTRYYYQVLAYYCATVVLLKAGFGKNILVEKNRRYYRYWYR